MSTVGSLGVVFGDIGTSPLYAMRTALSMEHNAVTVSLENVYGVISLVVWTLTLIVTIKYVVVVTRADNGGQGGILALVALLRRRISDRRLLAFITILGMLGAALFYGDSIITPAISVMSAIEGMSVVSPALGHLVVPVSAAVLAALFLIQPFGTGRVSRAFGPIMLAWFLTLALLGIPAIIEHPQVLLSLSPHWALELMIRLPFASFVLLGAVVLTVTGAEALYADMGHFGASAVRRAWLFIAMPALVIVYLGQGAGVITAPGTAGDPFFHLAPPAFHVPLIIFATVATIIASQAVISGAFAVTRQAMRLGLLPRLRVSHTSQSEEGQIYLPAINWILCAGVMALVVVFSSSARLASAYGLAVTGTLALESAVFLIFAATVWRWRPWAVVAYAAIIGAAELLLFAANLTKLVVGGWLPLLVAAGVFVVMTTWRAGDQRVRAQRRAAEGALDEFLDSIRSAPPRRRPGVAIFPHHSPDTTPLAMVQCVRSFHVLHEHVVIVRLHHANVPHVRAEDRIDVEGLSAKLAGIARVTITVGYADRPDLPGNLALALGRLPELEFDLDAAIYLLSVLALVPAHAPRLRNWRQALFLSLERNQTDRIEAFHLPADRTIVVGSEMQV
ncbi:KUP system potassium uptake protein [Brevibacterium sanguinis]|uniref:Probable potassium transport system protein Kup n=2 Tax=Brevibacterium TaxID=1696 RepID=A0A366IRC2_9MICO|nr:MULTISPECIES: KUP/HAK/KT family potassium transporter [Brevibacterium]RBP68053.1 KUP system potassium uptake protein [Brevibacterium sanguinis]RBP74530.1 KUP system potassium uptake protein [Brevibacterium celere]